MSTRYISTPLTRAASKEGEPLRISGFASVETLDRHDTVIRADGLRLKAFKANPQSFFEHGEDALIGATPIIMWETVEVKANDAGVKGLFVEGVVLDDTPEQKRVATFIRQGSIRTLSIGFGDAIVEWEETEDGRAVETIVSAELWEVSAVTIPSNRDTVITSVRGLSPEARKEVLNLLAEQNNTSEEDYETAIAVVIALGLKEKE